MRRNLSTRSWAVRAAMAARQPFTTYGALRAVAGATGDTGRLPDPYRTWYRDAARISDLADQVRRSGIEVTAVRVDVSTYSGPNMAPGWDPADIDGGDIAPMESVMLDGGRTQPVSVESRRSTTPALDAGRALAIALKVDPATVTVLPSGLRGGKEIASVQSPPLMERRRQFAADQQQQQ